MPFSTPLQTDVSPHVQLYLGLRRWAGASIVSTARFRCYTGMAVRVTKVQHGQPAPAAGAGSPYRHAERSEESLIEFVV